MKETSRVAKIKRPFKTLKCDLHLHTADDPHDRIHHTSKELISRAAAQDFDVISITNHRRLTFGQDLFEYARDRGILLIPGIELDIANRHVLMLNPPPGKVFSDFSSLWKWRRPETLVIAPHPYFPGIRSLNGLLLKNLHVFDAIEYCNVYTNRINFNQRAVDLSRSVGLPLIGNSDAHFLSQVGTTYSLVRAEKNVESIFQAIRRNRMEVVTRPLSAAEIRSLARRYLNMKLRSNMVALRPRLTLPIPERTAARERRWGTR